jgi:hypothetical protein
MTPKMLDSSAKLRATETGRVGENLAAYYLESVGIEASIVDRRGSDIWCRKPDGGMFSLEVKTAREAYKFSPNRTRYTYRVRNRKADHYMMVCLNTNMFRIFSLDELIDRWPNCMVYLKSSDFTSQRMNIDIQTLIGPLS